MDRPPCVGALRVSARLTTFFLATLLRGSALTYLYGMVVAGIYMRRYFVINIRQVWGKGGGRAAHGVLGSAQAYPSLPKSPWTFLQTWHRGVNTLYPHHKVILRFCNAGAFWHRSEWVILACQVTLTIHHTDCVLFCADL